jgi:competence protein ComEA
VPAHEEDPESETEAAQEPILVYICGAVAEPGVYVLAKEDRVIDLLEMAGGAMEDAYTQALNLAKKLSDGEKVYVPTYAEVSGGAYSGGWQQERTVNINTASAEELTVLPGIGASIAAAIVSHREANGFFESIEGLMDVKGIGEKKFEELKDLIVH